MFLELDPAREDGYFSVELRCSSDHLDVQWRKNSKFDQWTFDRYFCAISSILCTDYNGNEVVGSYIS